LAKAVAEDSERRRVAEKAAAERQALAAAGTDLGKLQTFVQQCSAPSCSVASDARERLAKAVAEDSERGRVAAKAAADRQVMAAARMEESERQRVAQMNFGVSVNYDMNGGDILVADDNGKMAKYFKTNSDGCLSACRANNGCVAFVFDKWNSVCYLKNQIGQLTQTPRSNAFVRTDMRAIVATTEPRTCPYNDSSMHGDVSKSFSAPSTDACKQKCEAETGCIAYTFRKADRQCSFFSSVSDRTKKDLTSNSGERTQNPC
jgi:hypothetical protein